MDMSGQNGKRNGKRNGHAGVRGRRIEIMDTTLRDGEQTEGISIMPEEKLLLAKQLLETLKVDRIEIASARASEGEHTAVAEICAWARKAGYIDRVEVLGFTDHSTSVEWVSSVGGKIINLLTKGSLKHCREQLRQSPEQHIREIERTIVYGMSKGVTFNVFLEDWSNGMIDSPEYVDQMVAALTKMPFRRIMLCDTLGILNPTQVREFVGRMVNSFPDTHFDYHGHNDYGLATANSMEAVLAGARGIHVTINGMGERAGNTSLDEVVVTLRDHAGCTTGVNEKALKEISRLVEVFSGLRISANKPITGDNVFTQTAGIHADGDAKGNLYESRLKPSRFGQARVYAMGKLMGKASLELNLQKLNIELSKEQKALVMERIIQLSDQKKAVTAADLPFIIADVLQSPEHRVFEVKDFSVVSNRGLRPTASILIRVRGEELHATASGDGGYDAFMRALRSLEPVMKLKVPRLLDYEVHIPPGGKTDALVETTISWEGGFKTRAVHSDQLAAAIEATAHAMNLIALKRTKRAVKSEAALSKT